MANAIDSCNSFPPKFVSKRLCSSRGVWLTLSCFVLLTVLTNVALAEDTNPPAFAGASNSGAVFWEFSADSDLPTDYYYIPDLTSPVFGFRYYSGDWQWQSGGGIYGDGSMLLQGEESIVQPIPSGTGSNITIYFQITWKGTVPHPGIGLEIWGDAPGWTGGTPFPDTYIDSVAWPTPIQEDSLGGGWTHGTYQATLSSSGVAYVHIILHMDVGGDLYIDEAVVDMVVHNGSPPTTGPGRPVDHPCSPTNVSPSNYAEHVDYRNLTLDWSVEGTCDPCTTYDVYFGSSSPPALQSPGQSNTDWIAPSPLSSNQWYYWQIDANVPDDIQIYGSEWRFKTGGKAYNPDPYDGHTHALTSAQLSWDGDTFADSYNVYFGTDPTPDAGEFQINQGGTTFDPPGDMDPETTYYWKIDEVIGGTPVPGDVWSFTTGLASPNLNELGFDEILFIKRPTFDTSLHFYTDFIEGCNPATFRMDNGIYRYNLDTQTVTPVITAIDMGMEMGSFDGIFYRMDLSFDATKVVFDYKPSVTTGFRIWECNLDGTGLTQLTFTPSDETYNIATYHMPGYGFPQTLYNYHYDDMHPCYTPDGKIIFTSTRCKITTLCDWSGVLVTPVLHRIDADGSNMEKLTDSPVSEFYPSVMPDGRILYTRWEYVDKNSVRIKMLNAMKPDGTTPEEIWGLDHVDPAALMHGRVVPGDENLVVATGCPHYPQGNSPGEILLIDTNKDVRTTHAMTRITTDVKMEDEGGWDFWNGSSWTSDQSGQAGRLFTTPYPLSKDLFLVSCKETGDSWDDPDGYDLYLLDRTSNIFHIHGETNTSLWHPMPLVAREVPEIPVTRISPSLAAANHAQCLVTDVYQGLEGVARGDIKYLRVNIVISRPWSAHRLLLWGEQSIEDGPILSSQSWRGALWPRVQLGIVPVEEDGSANFLVPADRNIQLQALDENYMEVQRERTYFNMRPGEVRSCIGCHERTGRAASITTSYAFPKAMGRDPNIPAPQPGEPAGTGVWAGWGTNIIHYETDVQPIFDSKCISCHYDGGDYPDLSSDIVCFDGDEDSCHYNVSYESLIEYIDQGTQPSGYREWEHGTRYVGLIIGEAGWHEQEADNNGAFFPPYTLGSHDSYLVGVLRGDHDATLSENHAGKLTANELIQVITWVDANAQYYGTYYGRHHGHWATSEGGSPHPNFRPVPTFEETIDPCAPSWHN